MVKKKWKQIVQGIFFLFCMVGVFMLDTPVHAESGLTATDQVKWEYDANQDKDVPVGPEDGAEYSKELWVEIPAILIHVKYDDVVVKDTEKLTLSKKGNTEALNWLDNVNDTELIKINAKGVGDYELTYRDGENSGKITLHIEYPKVGFYSTPVASVDGLMDGEFAMNEKDEPFYMILQDGVTLAENNQFIIDNEISDDLEVNDYIIYKNETGSNVYTITPNAFAARAGFTLNVTADISDEEDPYVQAIWIHRDYGTRKLYWTWSIDRNEDDTYQYRSNPDPEWFDWSVNVEITSYETIIAMNYMANGEKPTVNDELACCALDDLDVMDIFGNEVEDEALSLKAEKGFLSISPKKTGDYLVIYDLDSDDEAVIRVHVSEPSVGFYSSEDGATEHLLNEFDLANGDSFYIVFRNGWKLNTKNKHATEDSAEMNNDVYPFGVEVSGEKVYDEDTVNKYISYEKIDSTEYEIYKITPNQYIQEKALIVNAYKEYVEDGESKCDTMECWFGIKNTASQGLKYTEDIEPNDDDSITIREDAKWHDWTASIWFGLDAERSTVVIRYGDKYITADQIQIVDEFGNPTTDITGEDNAGGSAIDFFPTQPGNYKLLYKVDKETKILPITVDFPEVGFYTSDTKSAKTIIKDREFLYGKTKERTIYIIRDENYIYGDGNTIIIKDLNENTASEESLAWNGNVCAYTIPDGFTSEYELQYKYLIKRSENEDYGEYVASITISPKRLYVNAEYVEWDSDDTFVYDGKEHGIKLKEEKLPEGVKAVYEDNKKTDAGNYTAKVVRFEYVDNSYDDYYPLKVLATANSLEQEWKIRQAFLKVESLAWDYSSPLTYNGNKQSVGIKDLPGIDPTYEGNVGTDAGTYKATVTLTEPDGKNNYSNLADISPLELTWEIRKATFDTSKVAWNYKDAFVYDGTEKTVELTGLPTGLTAEYTGNKATDAGTYTAKATFKYNDKNYEAPDVSGLSELKWTITKKEESKPGTTEATPQPATTEAPKAPETTQEAKQEVKAGQTVTSGNASYKVISTATGEKTIEYVGNTDKKASKIVIPETIQIGNETYKVIAIADSAFKNNTKLKEVTIPANIQIIGKNAFAGCKNLKTIKFLGKDIKQIGKKAWKGVSKKATIQVPKKVKKKYKKLLKKAGYKGTIKGK